MKLRWAIQGLMGLFFENNESIGLDKQKDSA